MGHLVTSAAQPPDCTTWAHYESFPESYQSTELVPAPVPCKRSVEESTGQRELSLKISAFSETRSGVSSQSEAGIVTFWPMRGWYSN